MADYGTIEGAAKYVRHLTSNGDFGPSTKPSIDEVSEMLDESCAVINGWLSQYNYTVPVTATRAVAFLSAYANLRTAGLAELAQRSGGYSETDENRRENKFLAEFKQLQAFIKNGVLDGLGVTPGTPQPLAGFAVGGVTAGGQRLRPMFRRTSFGNQPDAESPSGREPDYSGDI